MKFSIHVLLGILLWSGIFFLPQGEAQTSRDQLREELKEELREELKEELRKEEEIRQEFQAARQEFREYVITPCRNVFFKTIQSRLLTHPNRHEMEKQAEKLFIELEKVGLKELLKKYPENEDVRMATYFMLRRECEKGFNF